MRQLCSSSDLRQLTDLVKRLVGLGIPCAVCKDGGGPQVSVWIQQDNDFPLALKLYAERNAPQAPPPWACLLDVPVPASEDVAVPASEGAAVPAVEDPASAAPQEPCATRLVLVVARGATRTITA